MTQTYFANTSIPLSLQQELSNRYKERELFVFRSRQSIPLKPQQIWVVCRGVVQLSTLHLNGDEVLLGLAGPSTVFGLPWSSVEPYQADALTDVALTSLTMSEVEQSPILAQELLAQVARRLKQAEALLAMSGCRRVEDRLRHLLLLLKLEVGHPIASGTRLGVKFTHQHLANAIGTTRVTVTRLLGRFRDEGWLKLDAQRHIIVLSDAAIEGWN